MGDMLFQNEADPQPGFTSSSSVGITDPAPPISLIDAMRPLDLTGYVTITDRSIDGGYGQVKTGFLEMDGTIFNVAVKYLRRSKSKPVDDHRMNVRLRREILIWQRLSHENIVRLLGTIHHDDSTTSTGMVSTWMAFDLNSYVRTDLSLSRRLQVPCDIAAGLAYLHSHDITHGDLHGGNVLIDDTGKACLVDFGLSIIKVEFEGTSYITSTVGGAIRYRAPELFPSLATFHDFTPTLTFACDVWSLGCVALQTLSGKVPYYDIKTELCVMVAITNGSRSHRPPADALTKEYWKYINDLWGDTPDSRPHADEAHTTLVALRDSS